ncbi:Polyprenol reductase 2 [Zea mays]|uniref:Polyprenol reductase 2 n=1 Tax=Zea mays TaxID=4577 RepID=A0A1D6E250_MAIZE|nr:Polyprenol reductase 2 [Zea mays]
MDTGSGPGLQYLLCLAWVAATLPIAAAALPIPRAAGGRFIHGLLCAFSSRGKTVRPSSSSSSKAVLRRLYETEHVFHYSPSARMHIIGYLTGIFYYVAAPLSLASSCLPETIQYLRYQIAEFIVKGRAKMPDLAIVPSHLLKPLLKLGWCQWIGAIIFIWGSLHQIHCHAILVCIRFCHSTSYLFVANANNIQQQLGSLREHKDSDEYVIPCGDWFSRVSCPHYLAELITNLSFAAVQTHKWYLRKFEDYPRSRYAIIPFVC